jgi:hypothetical protein
MLSRRDFVDRELFGYSKIEDGAYAQAMSTKRVEGLNRFRLVNSKMVPSLRAI